MTTFSEFWNANNVNHLWFRAIGNPTGTQLDHDTDTDCEEDWCDLGELVNEEQFDWLGDLTGTVVDGEWSWDGTGNPRDVRGNSITNVKAW